MGQYTGELEDPAYRKAIIRAFGEIAARQRAVAAAHGVTRFVVAMNSPVYEKKDLTY